jgi:hypothetical protein
MTVSNLPIHNAATNLILGFSLFSTMAKFLYAPFLKKSLRFSGSSYEANSNAETGLLSSAFLKTRLEMSSRISSSLFCCSTSIFLHIAAWCRIRRSYISGVLSGINKRGSERYKEENDMCSPNPKLREKS